jgi:hypothetical protein
MKKRSAFIPHPSSSSFFLHPTHSTHRHGTLAATATADVNAYLGAQQGGLNLGQAVRVFANALTHDLLRLLARPFGTLKVNLVGLFGRVGQDDHMIGLDFNKAAANGKILFLAASADHDFAEIKGGEQGRVIGQDAHPPFRPGQVDGINHVAEDGSLLGDDVTL